MADRFRAEVLRQRDSRLNEGLLWVGEKPFPALIETISMPESVYLALSGALGRFEVRRVVLLIERTVTLSILWGTSTHSDNWPVYEGQPFIEEPYLVEVCIIRDGQLDGEPLEYQNTEQVLKLIRRVQEDT
jgi:hypothetical protein